MLGSPTEGGIRSHELFWDPLALEGSFHGERCYLSAEAKHANSGGKSAQTIQGC